MKKKILFSLMFICVAFIGKTQNLESFTVILEIGSNNYLSIANKKAYALAEAISNKSAIDFALIATKRDGKQKLEWYNMSGKDGKTAAKLNGTATRINGISFDKEQFDKCKTNQDLQRMTGYITNNAFSHFASISDDVEKGITYHCFIIQMENGKRALLWIDATDNNTYKVIVKIQE
jgi:hypothetical protein